MTAPSQPIAGPTGQTWQVQPLPGNVWNVTAHILAKDRELPVAMISGEENLAYIVHCLNAFPALVANLKALLRQTTNIEVLGEWSALDMNRSLQKTTRAKVNEVVSQCELLLASLEQEAR